MALDQQLGEILDAFRRQISAQLDDRVRTLAAELSQLATADRQAAVRELRAAAEAEIARRSQETVAAVQADATRRLEAALAQARAERAQERIEQAKALEEQARALDDLRADHAKRIEEAVSAARAERTRRLDEAVAAARAQAVRDQESAVSEALAASRSDALRERAAALAACRAEADERVKAAAAAVRAEFEGPAKRGAQAHAEAIAGTRHVDANELTRMIEGIRRLDRARTLTEVLDALAEVIAFEAPRVALFLVRGNRLAGWRASGFAQDVDPRSIEVPSDQSSLLWRAIAFGEALSNTATPPGDSVTLPFGDLPGSASALAVPVRVGGETVAVIYADDVAGPGQRVQGAWPETVEVLGRHTGRCLEVLTISRGAAASSSAGAQGQPQVRTAQADRGGHQMVAEDDDSARRYARQLVSEVKLYYETAVAEGRQSANLSDRLRSEIDRARKLYDERVPAEIRARADFFGQELARTLASGDVSVTGAPRA